MKKPKLYSVNIQELGDIPRAHEALMKKPGRSVDDPHPPENGIFSSKLGECLLFIAFLSQEHRYLGRLDRWVIE